MLDKLDFIRTELRLKGAHLKMLGSKKYDDLHSRYYNLTCYIDYLVEAPRVYEALCEIQELIQKTIDEKGYHVPLSKLKFRMGCQGNMRCTFWID